MFRAVPVAAALLVVTFGQNGRAEPADAASEESSRALRPIEIGGGGFGRYDRANFCEADGDLVQCSTGRVFAGVSLAPRYRLSPLVSLGAHLGFAWKLGTEGTMSSDGSREAFGYSTFRTEAEARFHPLGPDDADLWFAASGGLSGQRKSVDAYAADGRLVATTSNTELGPIAGAAVGVDFQLADAFGVGPELRGAFISYVGDPIVAAQLGVGGVFSIGR